MSLVHPSTRKTDISLSSQHPEFTDKKSNQEFPSSCSCLNGIPRDLLMPNFRKTKTNISQSFPEHLTQFIFLAFRVPLTTIKRRKKSSILAVGNGEKSFSSLTSPFFLFSKMDLRVFTITKKNCKLPCVVKRSEHE